MQTVGGQFGVHAGHAVGAAGARMNRLDLRAQGDVGSGCSASDSGVRPLRTNSMIRCRNSGGYGGRLFGIVDSSPHRGTMSTEAGQLQWARWSVASLGGRLAGMVQIIRLVSSWRSW